MKKCILCSMLASLEGDESKELLFAFGYVAGFMKDPKLTANEVVDRSCEPHKLVFANEFMAAASSIRKTMS